MVIVQTEEGEGETEGEIDCDGVIDKEFVGVFVTLELVVWDKVVDVVDVIEILGEIDSEEEKEEVVE